MQSNSIREFHVTTIESSHCISLLLYVLTVILVVMTIRQLFVQFNILLLFRTAFSPFKLEMINIIC